MPFVSPMFSNDMVLQRDMADPIWGWTTPGTRVTVSIADHTAEAVSGDDGKWMTKIGPVPVGGPYTLRVESAQHAAVSFSNVLVGDVWVCSGQSNMEFGVGNLVNPAAEIGAADHPTLRLYQVPRLISAAPVSVNGTWWEVCTPDNLLHDGVWGGFSAVGYFFGLKLNEDLHVPIGLVHTSWGGTPAQAWAAERELGDKLPEFRGQLAELDAFRADNSKQTFDQRLDGWYRKNDAGDGKWSDPAFDDSGWQSMNVPGYFQNAGIPELVNNASVVWFRRTIDVPAEVAAKSVTLHALVDDDDAVWVNGTLIGRTRGVQVRRAYVLPAGVLKAGANQITVRVTDTGQPGGIYGAPESFYLDPAGEPPILLGGPWKVKLGVVVGPTNPFPVTVENNPNFPTVLYNGMISPVAPFGIKGAIWYQGESNSGAGYQYRTLLPTMITSWRDHFNEGNFPFIIVQLAGFAPNANGPGDDGWAELREAQYLTAKRLPNTGIATAIDVGDPVDIHPKNKEEVGRRLALVAEDRVYRQRVTSSGPVHRGMKVEGNAFRLRFDHTEGGLRTKDGGSVHGFAIAGNDHKWYWADARIEGKTVIVVSPKVSAPVAVRYGWASFTDANLYNGLDLPAFPFRTDDWKLSSQH